MKNTTSVRAGKAWASSLVFAFALLLQTPAFPFPETVSHGYQSCRICHGSYAGGAQLTEYGRSLSGVLLSSVEMESLSVGSELLRIGGEVRLVQLQRETDSVRIRKFLLMQADLQVRAEYGAFSGELSWSANERRVRNGFIQIETPNVVARAGRFFPVGPLFSPNHTLSYRAWWAEKEQLELLFLPTEAAELYLSLGIDWQSFAIALKPGPLRFVIWGHDPHLWGINAAIPLGAGVTALGEWNSRGWYSKIDLELLRGFHFYGALDSGNAAVGLQWLPIAHLEIEAFLMHRYGWLMVHWYL